ncbi:hypothetical protein BU16DRAFT_270117 [Lophium mytilinum]|uniref:Uncharacterized protein n=1 Tax=Lophium mytilinum TaxID=390894 RepID=A0A6A6R3V7_9PEZI|nr:hypothetical protein BU16DRAFT_270117 [Lophium mytilinum]
MSTVLVVLVVPETPVSQLPFSTVATAVLSETSSTFLRKPTRRSQASWRALLARAAALVAVAVEVVAAVAVAVPLLVTSEASTAQAEVEQVASAVAGTGEALLLEVPVAMVEDSVAHLPVAMAEEEEDTAAEWVVEATATHPAPEASPLGGRSLYLDTEPGAQVTSVSLGQPGATKPSSTWLDTARFSFYFCFHGLILLHQDCKSTRKSGTCSHTPISI